jgi:hypothetical protein
MDQVVKSEIISVDIVYIVLVAAFVFLGTQVRKWGREIIFKDELGAPHYGYKLHFMVGFFSVAVVLFSQLIFWQISLYREWFCGLDYTCMTSARKAGWWCFFTVGGFLIRPFSLANVEIKPSQTRLVRILCGVISGFGLGLLIVLYSTLTLHKLSTI